MKDDLVERCARAMAQADGYNADEPTFASGGTGIETTVYERRWQKYISKAEAVLSIAIPAILEEAAAEATRLLVFADTTSSADRIIPDAIRALAHTTGQEG